MSLLKLRRGRARQPSGNAAPLLDQNNPLCAGLTIAFYRLDRPDLLGKTTLTAIGSPIMVERQSGAGMSFPASSALTLSGSPSIPDSKGYSWLVVAEFANLTGTQILVHGDNSLRQFQFRSNAGVIEYIGFTTANAAVTATGVAPATNRPQAIGARVSAGTSANISVFQNGRRTANVAITNPRGITAPGEMTIGSRLLTANLSGSLTAKFCWDRPISDADFCKITLNANAFLELIAPEYRYLFVPDAGGPGAITGTAAITLGDITLGATASTPIAAAAALTLGSVALAAASSTAVSASLAVTLGDVTLAAFAGSGARTASLAVTLGSVGLTASAAAQAVGAASVQLGSVVVNAVSMAPINCSASVLLGRVTVSASAFGGDYGSITIPPSRTVEFPGGSNRVDFGGGLNRVAFDGGTNTVTFNGGTNTVAFDGGINTVEFENV